MRLLLDTNVVLWWFAGSARLPSGTRNEIGDDRNDVYISAVSAFEISTKKSLGKLEAPDGVHELITSGSFGLLPVHVNHGFAAGALPWHHRDPFDRLLLAQARHEGLTFVTGDSALAKYDVPLITC